MRALTVKNPWAWAIIHGGKDIENRTWAPNLERGERIAIHAGARPDTKAFARIREMEMPFPIWPPEYVYGAILGTVVVEGWVMGHRSRWAEDDAWNWVLTDPVALAEPIPIKGQLGLWNVPTGIELRGAAS